MNDATERTLTLSDGSRLKIRRDHTVQPGGYAITAFHAEQANGVRESLANKMAPHLPRIRHLPVAERLRIESIGPCYIPEENSPIRIVLDVCEGEFVRVFDGMVTKVEPLHALR